MAKQSNYICDMRCESFAKQMIKKEELLRIRWFLKNKQRLIDHLSNRKIVHQYTEEKKDVSNRQNQYIIQQTQKKQMPIWRPPNLDGSINLDIMKPIDPEIHAILFEKGVESFVTANNYMIQRLKKNPDSRFYFPECTNWIYGWHFDTLSSPISSKFALKAAMQAEFYQRKSSLERDPKWYHDCQTRNARDFC